VATDLMPTTSMQRTSARRGATRTTRATLATATWDTHLGRLVVGATERGLALVDFADDGAPETLVADLADALGVRPVRDAARTTPVRRAIDAYLAGRARGIDVPLDWTLAPEGFGRRVLKATARPATP
jgi:O6-methylguanine-DNA--protein-cysteine methyltransferase